MKKTIVITLALCLLSIVDVAQAQWSSHQFPGFVTKFMGCDFVNSHTGYICINQTVYKTTNGDANYTALNTGLASNQYLYRVKFADFNPNLGYAVGAPAVIIKTTNGGTNWIYQGPITTSNFLDVNIISVDTAIAVGSKGAIWKTTNGGTNWIDYSPAPILDTFYDIVFANGKGYVPAQQSDFVVWTSTNTGMNWTSQPISKFIGYSAATNGSSVFLGGFSQTAKLKIAKTTNQGATWDTIGFSRIGQFTGMAFANSTTGYAMANSGTPSEPQGYIYKTTDGGNSWQELSQVFNHYLSDITCSNSKVYVTADSGYVFCQDITVGIQNYSSTIPNEYSLGQNYPNPFNPSTKIKFSLPKAGYVNFSIFDISGREVAVLFQGNLQAGSYTYDFNASNLPSGPYFYKLSANNFTETKKMVLVK